MLYKGIFVISIDYEYGWGYWDKKLTEGHKKLIRNEVGIVKRLLSVFEKYNIPATWAIVGRLLEQKDTGNDVLWFDKEELINKIKDSPVGHEIGSHSYAHIIYGDSKTKRGDVELDIENAARVHREHDLPFYSFIFPRNREKHHDLLKKHGVRVFRGFSKKWYEWFPYFLWPLWGGLDYWLLTARTVVPVRHESGLVDVPESLAFVSRKFCFGFRWSSDIALRSRASLSVRTPCGFFVVFSLLLGGVL